MPDLRRMLSPFKKPYLKRSLGIQSSSIIGAWLLDESAGRLAQNKLGRYYPNLDLFDNGGFETAGAGGGDIWAYCSEVLGNGAIADETTLVHEGGSAHACKLTAGASANTYVRLSQAGADSTNEVKVFPGMLLLLTMWTRGDGTNAGRYSIYDSTNGTFIRSVISTGVTGTTYTKVEYSFTVPSGCYLLLVSFLCPTANGGIAYFDDISLVGNMPYAGRHAPSGVTYGVAGPISGLLGASFNGSDTGLLIGTKAFGKAWDGNRGSVIAWGKVDGASRWTDATSYRYLFHPKSRQDSGVYIVAGKNQTPDQAVFRRRVASSVYEKTFTFSPSGPTGWFVMGFAWDVLSTPKNFKGYIYAPNHTAFTEVFNEAPGSGIGDQNWDNNTYTVDDANCVLAGGSITAQEWIGSQGLTILWAGVSLSPSEFRRAMVPVGSGAV